MTNPTVTRRAMLQALLTGATATAAGLLVPQAIVKPERRFWQVPRGAPVGRGLHVAPPETTVYWIKNTGDGTLYVGLSEDGSTLAALSPGDALSTPIRADKLFIDAPPFGDTSYLVARREGWGNPWHGI